MTNLLLCILFNTLIIVIFKLFATFKINNLQAITINYFVASAMCIYYVGDASVMLTVQNRDWFIMALIIGTLFSLMFNVFAFSTQRTGIAVTSVSSKISVVIPVIFGYFLYSERLTLINFIGIMITLVSFYFTFKPKAIFSLSRKQIIFPLILFIGTGLSDSLMKYTTKFYLNNEIYEFLCVSFLIGAIIGLMAIIYNTDFLEVRINYKNIIGGIMLGIINVLSAKYYIMAMSEYKSYYFFPVLNISVVLTSGIIGFAVFREKLTKLNLVGILLAMLSIYLIAFHK